MMRPAVRLTSSRIWACRSHPAVVRAGVINLLQMSRSLSPCIPVAPASRCRLAFAFLLRAKPLILFDRNDHHHTASVLLDAHWFRTSGIDHQAESVFSFPRGHGLHS